MSHLSDTVWYKTHRLIEQNRLENQSLQYNDNVIEERGEKPTRNFSLRERIVLKSGLALINIGNGLIGQVDKQPRDPQIVS